MIVLDTHVWIWWVSNPEKLSPTAREFIDDATDNSDVLISCISTWEVALLVAKGRLELTMQVSDWVAGSEKLPFIRFIPVDNQIAMKSVSLPKPLHGDPADRIIVATAMAMAAPIVTRDERMLSYPLAETVW